MIKSGDCPRLIMRTQDGDMPAARSDDVHSGEYEDHEHFRFRGFWIINGISNMRTTRLLLCASAATLMSVDAITAHAAQGVYYDPSNAASPTGKTIGYELYRTIGCPGKQLGSALRRAQGGR